MSSIIAWVREFNTGKYNHLVRVYGYAESGYLTARDTATVQVVRQRGLAAVEQTDKLFGEGLSVGSP